MINVNIELPQWFTIFLTKRPKILLTQEPKQDHKFIRTDNWVPSPYRDTVWRADLVDMELINKLNTVANFQLCVIDIHSKYDCVVPFKDKKCITITISFEKKF